MADVKAPPTLFTREYTRDCEKASGEYLRHSPSAGTTDDADNLRQGFVETAKFYAAAFGENYLAVEPEGVPAS
jgi:hypothetical protein